MTSLELNDLVTRTISAPSCCAELKKTGADFLCANGQAKSAAAKKLLEELKASVCSIDSFIELTESAHGEQIFGKDQAKQMHAAGLSAKEKGARYCLCDACTNGGKILDDPSALTDF